MNLPPVGQRIASANCSKVDWLRRYLHKLFSPSTNHMSFATADGAVVAITMSNGYGSGVTIPGTGITCNNSLGEPELNPQGFFQIPQGGKFVSNMSPVTAWNSAGSSIAMGSPGASRITTCLFQGWINFALEDMRRHGSDPGTAISCGKYRRCVHAAARAGYRYEPGC